jgi:hypothetical protein
MADPGKVFGARYLYFQMAQIAVPRELLGRILSRFGNLRVEVG